MQKYMRWSAILVVLMLVLAACQGGGGSSAGESAGGFDLSRGMPLYSGGQMMDQQGSEGASSFDATLAPRSAVGTPRAGSAAEPATSRG